MTRARTKKWLAAHPLRNSFCSDARSRAHTPRLPGLDRRGGSGSVPAAPAAGAGRGPAAQRPVLHGRRHEGRAGLLREPVRGPDPEPGCPGRVGRPLRPELLPVSPVQSVARFAADQPASDHDDGPGQPDRLPRGASGLGQPAAALPRAGLCLPAGGQDLSRHLRRSQSLDAGRGRPAARRRRGGQADGDPAAARTACGPHLPVISGSWTPRASTNPIFGLPTRRPPTSCRPWGRTAPRPRIRTGSSSSTAMARATPTTRRPTPRSSTSATTGTSRSSWVAAS